MRGKKGPSFFGNVSTGGKVPLVSEHSLRVIQLSGITHTGRLSYGGGWGETGKDARRL